MAVRNTKQKNLLDSVIKTQKGFFSTEELHAQVPSVGIATVYRRLNTLVQKGKLHAYMCGSSRVFSVEQTTHAHFTCENCERTTHFVPKLHVEDLPGKVCHVQLDVTGVCLSCQE